MQLEEGLDTGPVYCARRGRHRRRGDARTSFARGSSTPACRCCSTTCRRRRRRRSRRSARRRTPTKIEPAELRLDWSRPAGELATGSCGSAARGRRSAGSGCASSAPRSAENGPRPRRARRDSSSARCGRGSSSSRSNPKARRAARDRVGQRRPARARRTPVGMTTARRVALDALDRIDEGAYANLVARADARRRAGSKRRDRDFVTELVYGTTRMRRACDWLIDQFVERSLEPEVRGRAPARRVPAAVPRDTPPHAAVSARRSRSRRSGRAAWSTRCCARWPPRPAAQVARPGHELSYPDWIVDRLAADLGPGIDRAHGRARSDEPSRRRSPGARTVTCRTSRRSGSPTLVRRSAGETVLDMCAAPGGKATGDRRAAAVVAADVTRAPGPAGRRPTRRGSGIRGARRRRRRAATRRSAARRRRPRARRRAVLGPRRAPPPGRRPLAHRARRRRRAVASPAELAVRGRELLAPGGVLVYSVCTLTDGRDHRHRRVARGRRTRRCPVRRRPSRGRPWAAARCSCRRRPAPTGCTSCACAPRSVRR